MTRSRFHQERVTGGYDLKCDLIIPVESGSSSLCGRRWLRNMDFKDGKLRYCLDGEEVVAYKDFFYLELCKLIFVYRY